MINFYKPNIPYFEIKDIINSGILINGPYTRALEKHFRDRFGVKYAIACASGTSGLIIALKCVPEVENLNYDCHVGIPSFTWPSTLYAIECNQKCKPLYYDIDKETWLIDPNRHIFLEPEVIIAVDTFGNECNIKTSIPVVYDAAHGYGLPNLGGRGLIEVVSFAATKCVTGGQGGIILTNDKSIAIKARKLVTLYAKITEISALMCLETIAEYEQQQRSKERIIKAYKEQIKLPFKEQRIESATNHSVYAILLENKTIRDKVVHLFEKNNIETKIYYKPLASLDNTNYVYDRILCLPLYTQIEHHESVITNIINKAMK
jgi:dTDP-4-amino-4,6-dideoxygalactose transaminase